LAVSRSVISFWVAAAALAWVAVPLVIACSSSADGPIAPGPTSGEQNGGSTAGSGVGVGGSRTPVAAGTSSGGAPATGGVATAGNAGTTPASGGASGGVGGAAGVASGGTPAGGSDGADICGTPPTHKLNVMAAKGEHSHAGAGVDTRAKTMLGKLVIDYGVAGGGYIPFLAKRGYHSIGAPGFAECAAPDLDGDRTRVGKCRLGEIDTTEKAIEAKLAQLQSQYPEEDWGYFLDANGKLRWSDVATTGFSHGATTAAINGRYKCLWRAVSRSGPRDDTCGKGPCTAPLSTPSYDPACMDAEVAEWQDSPSKTPMDRFYGIVGMTDGQCGDIMFNMNRTKYPGPPTIFDAAGADISTTHQFFSQGQGHSGFFDYAPAMTVLEIAFGIPPENRNPTF
jgi:hypothetical protein